MIANTKGFGTLLRSWRNKRKASQLELAAAAGTSQRHVSFLESGRANPSAALIHRLSDHLALPPIERNALLSAAGYAAPQHDPGFEEAELASIQVSLQALLDQHEPYPATVLDRAWNLRMANRATWRILGQFLAAVPRDRPVNVMALCFDPDGLRPALANWNELAPTLLARVQSELRQTPANEALRALHLRLQRFPDVPEPAPLEAAGPPVFPLRLRRGTLTLDLITIVATLGTTPDIARQELRLELYLPADATARDTVAAMTARGD